MLLPGGIAFGLSAALTFGLSDFLSALISRRFGTLYTLLGVQVVGVILFLVYFLRTGEAIHLQAGSLPMVLLIGVGLALLDSLAYFSFYTALSIGPVAVVSPITASCAGVTVLLAVSVGELPTFWQGVGICSILGGVILVSLNSSILSKRVWYVFTSRANYKIAVSATWQRIVQWSSGIFPAFTSRVNGKAILSATWRRIIQRKSGSFLAGLAMIGFGFHLFFLSRWTQIVGPLAAVFFIRVFSALLLGVVAACFRRDAMPRRLTFKSLGAISLLGVLDTVGLLAYSAGTTRALTSIVTTLESSYSLIPIFLGILVFRERLARVQGFGIVAILLGLGLITGLHS